MLHTARHPARFLPAITLILLLAFGARAALLDARSIWFDEGYSVWLARMPLDEMVRNTALDLHPPLYYAALHVWRLVAGEGEYALRFLSVLMGVMAVAVTYRFGRALGGERSGMIAALLLALSRFAIGWSQQLRMYELALLLATLALWLAYRFWRCGRWGAGVGYALAMIAALHTYYLTALAFALVNLAFPLVWWHARRSRALLVRWLITQSLIVLAFLPWAIWAFPQHYSAGSEAVFSAGFGVQLYLVTLTMGVESDPDRLILPALASLAVTLVCLPLAWRGARPGVQRPALLMLLAGLVLPALAVFALALPLIPGYARPLTPRYFLPLAACLYVLTGWGIAALGERRWFVPLLIVAAISIAGLLPFYQGRVREDDTISLARTLTLLRGEEDAVLLYNDRLWPVFSYHYPGAWTGVSNTYNVSPETADALLAPLWMSSDVVWVVQNLDAQRIDQGGQILDWLRERAAGEAAWDFGENRLLAFARNPERATTLNTLAPNATLPSGVNAPEIGLLASSPPLPRSFTGTNLHIITLWSTPPPQPIGLEVRGAETLSIPLELPRTPSPDAPTLVVSTLPLPADLPGGHYEVWLADVRLGSFTAIERPLPGAANADEMEVQVGAHFGDSIELVGYTLAADAAAPGQNLPITLYWRADAPLTARYKISVFLLGSQWNPSTGNPLWAQIDQEPLGWALPTTLWRPGSLIGDTYALAIDKGTPPGDYALGVVVYGLVDGARLPVHDAEGAASGDLLILNQITIR